MPKQERRQRVKYSYQDHKAYCHVAEQRTTNVFDYAFTLAKDVFIMHVLHPFAEWVCKKKGHAFIDESYATPDTGCVAGTCIRCGYGFETVLY